jgi:Holliday junction resolvase-like predicted endonuclease
VRFEASYLRTSAGLEIDLVLEHPGGGDLLALELKARRTVDRRDAARIERAARLFGDRYRGGLVVYRGDRVERLSATVYAVPDWVLLATAARSAAG